MDKWFMSFLVAYIVLNDDKSHSSGNTKKNKREISPSFLPSRKTKVDSTQLASESNKMLASYCSKTGKSVLLFSTMLYKQDVNEETGKLVVINFCSETKLRVDTFNQLVHIYYFSWNN
ncbi:hypothetical protein PR048_001864 [Dryococelus australis]|uniref:Uncharacterized protein n=1 Tax=Dryococelus australis TaxID=614101 RepID=A0ABQ9IIJ2_9NEOP|nr:hypothetical protein PR048_001864 [Dryococelus australis]